MPTKYILWRVANGWLMTTTDTIWEDHDRRSSYAVFTDLHDFVAWEKEQQRKYKQRIRNATRPNDKRTKHPGRPTIVAKPAA